MGTEVTPHARSGNGLMVTGTPLAAAAEIGFLGRSISRHRSIMSGGKIFISYRRADSQWAAARLYDNLTHAFPNDRIFMDVDGIAPGQDFVAVLENQVGACDVFLALIGPEWLSLQAEGGARRLDDKEDFVRIEIASALTRDDTVTIPVLLDSARPPAPDDLPDDLKPLARRHFARLTHEGFRTELEPLKDAIAAALARGAAGRAAATPPAPQRNLRKPALIGLAALLVIALGGALVERLMRPADPSATPDLAVFKECPLCPEMIALPGGTFLMGSPEDEEHRSKDEQQREVTIGYRFAIGRTEMTWNEYSACVAEDACEPVPGNNANKDSMPVTNISWIDAKAYAAWLNNKVPGEPYRLPTEAEWEYAARAGTTTAYYWGEQPDRAYANMGREVCCIGSAEGADKWVKDAPVASFKPNAFGLYDMLGNMTEWVEDTYESDVDALPTDGSAYIWEADNRWAYRHTTRGGDFSSYPWNSRSAFRNSNDQNWRNYVYGFRLVRDMTPR
ncbi:MAG: SUMF1/EgtB/PvdO family nonheme iron enzyme [Pseudomonadota bacterium]